MPPTSDKGIAHTVALGSSWKRSGSAPQLTTLRFAFKPTDCDWKRPGKVTSKGGKAEVRMSKLEGARSGSRGVFTGAAEAAKTTMCFLIQDADGKWRLERAYRHIRNLTSERDQPFLANKRAQS